MEKKCCIVIEEVVYSINSLTNNLQFIKLVHPTNQHNKWLKCERVKVKLFRKSGQPAWCPCKLVKKRTNITMNPDKKYWSSLALQLKYRYVTITVTTTRGISSYPVKLKATAAQIKQTFYMKKSNKMLLELCFVERSLQSCFPSPGHNKHAAWPFYCKGCETIFCLRKLFKWLLSSKWEAWYVLQRPESHFLHSLVTLQCSHYTWSDQYVSCHLSLL